jgi:hypothetical protein
MRIGRYFRIPQGPGDIERLWRESQALSAATRPVWVSPDDAPGYRLVGTASWSQPASDELPGYLAEINELRDAGLIVDQAPSGLCEHRFYLRAPTGPWNNDAVFAIGIYAGDTPFSLRPAPDVSNPVLTHRDVTDIPAAFVADPFMIRVGQTWHLFFEIMHARSGKGEIGLATSPDGRAWTYRQVVLAEPFHLSYPYVFEWRGDHYMVPETYQAGAVRLYRATDFPTRWACVRTLLEGPFFADSSPFVHDGRWWMFTDASAGMDNQTLRLYTAEEPVGPWREHPRSPVADGDPRKARPAGRVLAEDGRVFRFAQACLPYYGTEVRAFEVTELSPTAYGEREVQAAPILKGTGSDWNACGMHHVDVHRESTGHWRACVDGWTSETVLRERGATS